MTKRNFALSLSVLAGACALALPAISHAGNVGYYGACWHGDKAGPITAAGQTPVAVASITPATLASLNSLIVEGCGSYVSNADISAAVANGMSLIINDWSPGSNTGAALPGSPSMSFAYTPGSDIDLAAGTPIKTGPGGTLTNTSMDGGSSSNHGYTMSALPAGGIALLTTATASQSVAFSYLYGNGRVIYNAIPLDAYLTGASLDGNVSAPGMRAYLTNLVAWASGAQSTTCASEGYKNTQLTWCKNICENGLTGKVLDSWIHRWIERYRQLPYCAVGGLPD